MTEQDFAGTELRDDIVVRVDTQINPKWHLDRLIGVGGMAAVYSATHRNGSRAALKVLHPEFAHDEIARERFLREARIASQVQHPCVVKVMDDDVTDNGDVFLVMELLEGETLSSRLAEVGGILPVDQVFAIFDPILELLGEFHNIGIVHRDIKPANIFLTGDGQTKVLDFGIARAQAERGGPNATRQGTAIGTPSFMAPEQALGLGEMIDGRADIFSVGACMYMCLSGAKLHEARVPAEAFVLAATRAAPSLAGVAPSLSPAVIALVDRALAYERGNRFADAAAMRAEMRAVVALMRVEGASAGQVRRAGVVIKGSDLGDQEPEGESAEARNARVSRLRVVWKHIGLFLANSRQYGWGHPEPARLLHVAHEQVLALLADMPDGVRWDVTPYAFAADGESVWESDRPPFDRVPYQLFADGLRIVQILPGVTEQELRDLSAILTRDAMSSAHDGSDAVTTFWDRHFEHVAYQAIDAFVEGDAAERQQFEDGCAEVQNRALGLAGIDLDWDESSVEAQAMQRNIMSDAETAAQTAAATGLDSSTLAALSAQLMLPTDRWQERYVEVLTEAYVEAERLGDLDKLNVALREWVRDQVALHKYDEIFSSLQALIASLTQLDPEQATRRERQVTEVMLSPDAVQHMFTHFAHELRQRDVRVGTDVDQSMRQGLIQALSLMGTDALFAAAVDMLEVVRETDLGSAIRDYVKKWLPGHEAEIGSKLVSLAPELAIDLVHSLDAMETESAIAAMRCALEHPHIDVRLEAMVRTLRGAPQELWDKLSELLDNASPVVRQHTLRAVGRLQIRAVGRILVRKVQSADFHHLVGEERSLLLTTIAELYPSRAEELASEILLSRKLLGSAERERSRVLAAEVLGQYGSWEAIEVLERVCNRRWGNSAPVREASQQAIEAIRSRKGRKSVVAAAPAAGEGDAT